MSIPDVLMEKYLRLATDLAEHEIQSTESENPRPEVRKRILAMEIVRLYHGKNAALNAAARFDEVFVEGRTPADVPEIEIPSTSVNGDTVYVPKLLTDIGFAASTSAARRLISQGGVYIEGERLTSEEVEIEGVRGKIVAVGKRRFARLV
jgi:tyrosyl-tRNA synthetase